MPENKPDYRFKCEIVDDNNGEIILSASTFVSSINSVGECESIDEEMGKFLRGFNYHKQKYEEETYGPKE